MPHCTVSQINGQSPHQDDLNAFPWLLESAMPLPPKSIKNICCLGAGYVGGPTCAVTANKCPDIKVNVVDFNVERIQAWHTDHLPIYEPGLLDILKPARDGIAEHRAPNLFFSTDVKGAIAAADLIFLCVPTPTKTTGTGAGYAADMVYVERAARMIADAAENDKIVVEKSTVPCRTAEDIRKTFAAVGRPGVNFDILSNPEFLAEGTAIKDLLEPDRILIGSLNEPRGLRAATALADVYANWVPRERLITMNLWSAEMAKLAANALLAQRISSINSLSAVCEATGANIDEVSYACGLDTRIGSRMLKSSVGFGGSCFKKDVLNLVYIAESQHLTEVAAYWKAVIDINEYQKDRFIKRIVRCLFQTLTNKKVAILGYAYKKDTGDTRESAAISIVNNLLTENAEVSIYDPKVQTQDIWQSLRESNDRFDNVKQRVTICSTAYDACEDADAIVIATEWDEFCNKTSNPSLQFQPKRHTTTARFHRTGSIHDLSSKSSLSSVIDASSSRPSWTDTSSQTPITPATEHSSRSSTTEIPETHDKPATDSIAPLPPPRSTKRQFISSSNPVANVSDRLSSMSVEDGSHRKLDWSHVARVMRRPMFIFDGRNVVDAAKLGRLGFWVEGIGKAGVGFGGA